ncbi:MAG: GntR family transcriptional regulator, partial [Pikeienuella sp.]
MARTAAPATGRGGAAGAGWPARRPMTLPEQIAEDASRRILSGELRAGERLGEIELAARYGVSRGP